MPDAVNLWNLPLEAHQNYAQAQEETTSLQKSLGSKINDPTNYVIHSATQVNVTTGQKSALDLLMGTQERKEGAVLEEPPGYHNRRLGSSANPWEKDFGSRKHRSDQQQMIETLVKEETLIQDESELTQDEGEISSEGNPSQGIEVTARENRRSDEQAQDLETSTQNETSMVAPSLMRAHSDEEASVTSLPLQGEEASQTPSIKRAKLERTSELYPHYQDLGKEGKAIIDLLAFGIQPHQEQLDFVLTQMARIRQA